MPRETIARIAREYATTKPGDALPGLRHAAPRLRRAGGARRCVLAAITGNVGVPGGWASGLANQPDGGCGWNVFPAGENPVRASIPVFLWTRGRAPREGDGPAETACVGAERLDNDIKLIYAVATNCLINQHANINRSVRDPARRVEGRVHRRAGQLPDVDRALRRRRPPRVHAVRDVGRGGRLEVRRRSAADAQARGAARRGEERLPHLRRHRGRGSASATRTPRGATSGGWVEWCLDHYRRTRFPDLPSLDELEASNAGVYRKPVTEPAVAFADFRRDPERHPLPTPSGKIEIFSKRLLRRWRRPDEIPAVPKYIQEWESPFGPEAGAVPAAGRSATTPAPRALDARQQRLARGGVPAARVHQPAGRGRRAASSTATTCASGTTAARPSCRAASPPRIMPGVVDIPQGAWWSARRDGRRSRRLHQCADLRALDAARLRHRAAHGDGAGGEGLTWRRATRFFFDAAACSGCKACQVACKDKHALPVGVLWRRVYEVAGRRVEPRRRARGRPTCSPTTSRWRATTAPSRSASEVCPTRAMHQRADGLVLHRRREVRRLPVLRVGLPLRRAPVRRTRRPDDEVHASAPTTWSRACRRRA